MDISKFNQELAYKVAKANGLEKHQRIDEAINIWIEITEMVISMSKLPKIDFAFRSMLIERTQQIIKHIKELKQKSQSLIKIQAQELVSSSPTKNTETEIEETQSMEHESSTKEPIPSIQDQKHPDLSGIEKNQMEFIESEDIQNIPKGFKEIKTSEDFTIITPHDKEYVEKILSQDIDMSALKPESNNDSATKEVYQKDNLDSDKMICYACGTEVPVGSKICPNCGTKLK